MHGRIDRMDVAQKDRLCQHLREKSWLKPGAIVGSAAANGGQQGNFRAAGGAF